MEYMGNAFYPQVTWSAIGIGEIALMLFIMWCFISILGLGWHFMKGWIISGDC